MVGYSVQQAFHDWMDARLAGGVMSPHTTAAYQQDITAISRELCRVLGLEAPDGADPGRVVQVEQIELRPLRSAFAGFAVTHSPASLARAQSTWRGLCGFLVSEGLLQGDPMAGIAKVKIPKREPKPLKGEEETAALLFEHLITGRPSEKRRNPWPERDLAVLATLSLTGVRSVELRGMSRGDIYGTSGEQRIRVLGKGNKERTIPIKRPLAVALAQYEQTRQERFPEWKPAYSDPLFVNTKNERLSVGQLTWIVKSCMQEAGLSGALPEGAVVHAFRHLAGTTWAAHGASATEIQTLLGHASLATSQGYILASAREVRASAEANPLYDALPDD